jgi:hypothetical protein
VLGREAAKVFADLHRDHAVDLRCGVQVAEITGSDGRASGVHLADGRHIEADAVIVGVGITPATQLAMEAGLEVDNGIRVDAQLRSSDPDIYAAGDVANAFHPLLGKHIQVEHWANALHQPQTAAKAMLGQDVAYHRVPYFMPTSTTWAWSTPATSNPTATTKWSSAAMSTNASFSRSGWPWPRAGRHERQRLGRDRPDAGPRPVRQAGRGEQAGRPAAAARNAPRQLTDEGNPATLGTELTERFNLRADRRAADGRSGNPRRQARC